jgi:outer membrane protein assembly factor BamB
MSGATRVCVAMLLTVMLAGCGGNTTSTELSPATELMQPLAAEHQLVDVLAGIDAVPRPEAVEANLWTELTTELKRVLSENNEVRTASQPPTGDHNCIADLAITGDGSSGYALQWSYLNTGDYNQDGLVSISDIASIAHHWSAKQADPDWDTAKLADGNGDGVINISDVTPIAENWQSFVASYGIFSSTDEVDYPGTHETAKSSSTVVDVAEMLLTESTAGPGGWRVFSYDLALPTETTVYWVRPLDAVGEAGNPSNCASTIDIEEIVLSVSPESPNQPSSGSGTEEDPVVIEFFKDYRLLLVSNINGNVTEDPETTYKTEVLHGDVYMMCGTYEGLDSNELYFRTLKKADGSIAAQFPGFKIVVSSNWPMFGYDAQHTHRCPYNGPSTGKLKWKFHTTGPGFNFEDAVVGPDGTIYVGSGSELYAFNPDNSLKWRTEETIWPNTRPVLAADGTIYVGSSDRNIYAYNPDGTQKWGFPMIGRAVFSPAIGADGTIYSGCLLDEFYAINPDGTEKWSVDTFSLGVSASPAVGAEGTIYVAFGYYFCAFNPDGNEKWRFTLQRGVRGTPVFGADGTIYVFDFSGKLYAFDPGGAEKWSSNIGDSGHVNTSAAIGADWTIYIGISNSLHAVNPDGSEMWSFTAGGSIQSSPAVSPDGAICIGSDDGLLYAIKPDGTEKWSFATGGYVRSSPAIGANGAVYVGSYDHKFYAVNPDGTEKWSTSTGGAVISSPAIGSDGTVYLGSQDNNIYAVNPDGTEKWTYATGNDVVSSPAVGVDGTIYIGSNDSNWYAVNPDGTERWAFKTASFISTFPTIDSEGTVYIAANTKLNAITLDGTEKWLVEPVCDSLAPAIGTDGMIYLKANSEIHAVNPDGTTKWFSTTDNFNGVPSIGSDGTVYAGNWDNSLYAYDSEGTEKWAFDTGSDLTSYPAISADGTIYVGCKYGGLIAINPDGTEKWRYFIYGSVNSTPAIGADGMLYFGSNNNWIYALRPDGSVQWTYGTGGSVHSSPAIGADGTLYVGSSDGKLYAFGP